MLHGGRSAGLEPTTPVQLSVLRMIPLKAAVQRAVRPAGVEVRRPRFRLRGWNGAQASPVGDINEWLDEAAGRLRDLPVALIGHSMGARAAMRAAGHWRVRAVAGLAPWLPPGEPVAQLAGRQVLLVHGDQDHVTSASQTWAYAERARAVTAVTTAEIPGGDHAMLRHAARWHRIAAEFARAAFGLPEEPEPPGGG
jgi:alpha-beta hydrolase superfamily lysophospholipase